MKRNDHALLWGILCLVTLHFVFVSFGLSPGRGRLGDVDCYTRLNHVLRFYETGSWYDITVARSNAPYGETIHWTRPLDVLLISGAWLLTPFLDFKEALFWWGWLIGPLLQVAALIFLLWATRPLFDHQEVSLIGLLFICQPGILSYYLVGSPDHHGLLLTVFILAMGFTLRLLLNPFRPGLCYAAGAINTLSLWISVESFLPLLLNIAALGIVWIMMNRDYARKNFHFYLGFFITSGIALLLIRPWYDFFQEEYDRLSFVHLSIFGFIALFWLVVLRLNRLSDFFKRFANRIFIALAGVTVLIITIWHYYPKVFGGPFADVDPRVFPIWLNKIYNFQPLISHKGFHADQFFLLLGPVIPAIPFVLYRLWKEKREEYQMWLYVFIGLLIFLPVSLYQARWVPYAVVISLIPLTELLYRVLTRQEPFLKGLLRPIGRALVVMIFCTGFIILGGLLPAAQDEGKTAHHVSLSRICEYLDKGRWQNQSKRIVAFYFWGPEILYRTHHEVIATPDHRNWQGILDTYAIMTAAHDEDALKIIRERKINLILLCPEANEEEFYSMPNQESTFYRRLCEGAIPPWVRPISLPPDLSHSFRLFEVID